MPDQLYDPAALASRGSAENVGGPRHYHGGEVTARAPWRCPSCGFENVVRELGQGCESCHAGEGAAKHVGVDPIVRPKPKAVDLLERRQQARAEIAGTIDRDIKYAYSVWINTTGRAGDVYSYDAFKAGWRASAVTQPVIPKEQTDAHPLVATDVVGGDLPRAGGGEPSEADPPSAPDDQGRAEAVDLPAADGEGGAPAFVGTARDRTLLAALIFFREQVMAQGPEEVVSGEWMSPGDLDRWIAELKGPYA